MTLDRAINISDLRHLAMKRLPRMAFDFIEGGCDDEDGLAENEFCIRGLSAHAALPRGCFPSGYDGAIGGASFLHAPGPRADRRRGHVSP